jgi:adenylosuccinate synthase
MKRTAIIGIQWGDEGKAKIVSHYLRGGDYGVVARYGGGANAGHTQIDRDGKEVITHVVPAGILTEGVYNLVLADVMVDPVGLMGEIRGLQEAGHPVSPSNLGISGMAQVTLRYHRDFEKESERRKGKDRIGTTMRAIGPTAVSKYGREGIRLAEFLDPESFERILRSFSRERGNIVARKVPHRQYVETYGEAAGFLAPFMVDEAEVIRKMGDRNWLYEGSQGIMLDILYGSIPYVTSSTPHNPPPDADERIGVAKAYVTRVGEGNLPTRMDPPDEEAIRGIRGRTPGAEFGATTGRPRGCGWFDAVAARHAIAAGRIGSVDMTKLDRLSGFPRIRVATAYTHRGSRIEGFPADRFVFQEVEPVYHEFPGWEEDLSRARELEDLPKNAVHYLSALQDIMECSIGHVSVGQGAEQTIPFCDADMVIVNQGNGHEP